MEFRPNGPEMLLKFIFIYMKLLVGVQKEEKCVVFTCSSDSWEMWFTAAYDSILGLKWLMMALKDKNTNTFEMKQNTILLKLRAHYKHYRHV